MAGLALLLALAAPLAAKDIGKPRDAGRDEALLADRIEALAPQRPGVRDLYVLGVAGDGSERVFRNEVLHLGALAEARLGAAGRVLLLANHPPDDDATLPRASGRNLRAALAGIGARLDPDEDLLLLYVTTHGSEDHRLLLRTPGRADRLLGPEALREALDASGIRHRVLVVSACYSGGFIDALAGPDTLVLTAARHDRPSFGCGHDAAATYFGRAWLVDGLNASLDFEAAFAQAREDIRRRERREGLRPSHPQLARGEGIAETLLAWRAGVAAAPPLPYPYADAAADEAALHLPPVRAKPPPRGGSSRPR